MAYGIRRGTVVTLALGLLTISLLCVEVKGVSKAAIMAMLEERCPLVCNGKADSPILRKHCTCNHADRGLFRYGKRSIGLNFRSPLRRQDGQN